MTLSAAAENLVENGTFASRHGLRGWIELGSDSSAIAGWQITEGHVNLVGRYWQSVNSVNSVQLDGVPRGTIQQRLRTTRGKRYVLKFSLAGNPDGPPRVKTLGVRVANVASRFTFDVRGHSRNAMGYVVVRVPFRATQTTSLLRFTNAEPSHFWGPVIANVRVEPVGGTSRAPRSHAPLAAAPPARPSHAPLAAAPPEPPSHAPLAAAPPAPAAHAPRAAAPPPPKPPSYGWGTL